jgi:hypothetical protein
LNEEKREITGVRSAPTFAENPFMRGSVTKIKGRKKHYDVLGRPAIAIDQKTGEVLGGVEHKVVRVVDDSQFVKVFSDGIAGIYDLSKPGTRVFRYLFDVVQEHPNVDKLYLYFMDALEEPWTIPKSVFFRGMAELLEKNFIARSQNPNMFYLNPAMIWNGNRFSFVQEFIKTKAIPQTDDLFSETDQTTTTALALAPSPAALHGTPD